MSIDYDVMFNCFVKKEKDGSYSPCAVLEGELNLKSGDTNKLLICENNSIYLGSTDINGNKSQLDKCIVGEDYFVLKNSQSDLYLFKVCKNGEISYTFSEASTKDCKIDLTGYPNDNKISISNPYKDYYYHCGWNSDVYKYVVASSVWDDFSKKRGHLIRSFPVFDTNTNYDVIYVCQKEGDADYEYGYVFIQITNNGWKIWLEANGEEIDGYESKQPTLPISKTKSTELNIGEKNIIEIKNEGECKMTLTLAMENGGSLFMYKLLNRNSESDISGSAEFNLLCTDCLVKCGDNCQFPNLPINDKGSPYPSVDSMLNIYNSAYGTTLKKSEFEGKIVYNTWGITENYNDYKQLDCKRFKSDMFESISNGCLLVGKITFRDTKDTNDTNGKQWYGTVFICFKNNNKCDILVFNPATDLEYGDRIVEYSSDSIGYVIEKPQICPGSGSWIDTHCITFDMLNATLIDWNSVENNQLLRFCYEYCEGMCFRMMPPQVNFDNIENSSGSHTLVVRRDANNEYRYQGYSDLNLIAFVEGDGGDGGGDSGDDDNPEDNPDDNPDDGTDSLPKNYISVYSNCHSEGGEPTDGFTDINEFDGNASDVKSVFVEYQVGSSEYDCITFYELYELEDLDSSEQSYNKRVKWITFNYNSGLGRQFKIQVNNNAYLDLNDKKFIVYTGEGNMVFSEPEFEYIDFNFNYAKSTDYKKVLSILLKS